MINQTAVQMGEGPIYNADQTLLLRVLLKESR